MFRLDRLHAADRLLALSTPGNRLEGLIALRNQLVAQAFQPVQRRLKPAATITCLLIATQY